MTAPPDPAAVAAAERDHAARLLAVHKQICHAEDCPITASLAGHAERTARQAELLAPAQTPEMF